MTKKKAGELSAEEENLIENISGEPTLNVGDNEGTDFEVIDLSPMNEEEPENFPIENASEVVNLSKEDVLKADMEKLNSIDVKKANILTNIGELNFRIITWSDSQGYVERLEQLGKEKKELVADYDRLKKDIAGRGLALSKKSDYEQREPAPGVKIQKSTKNRELIVDPVEAIEWAIEKKLVTFLILDEEKYLNQLDLGTMPDQPGEIDKTPTYKATISLKPYQDKK